MTQRTFLSAMSFLVVVVVACVVLLASMRPPMNRLEQSVIRQAQMVYGLPANYATCWHTGPHTFACQLSGDNGWKGIAYGTNGIAVFQ